MTTHLDLQNLIMVSHSTGGGEVVRYVGRHGTGRVAKAVLVGAGGIKGQYNCTREFSEVDYTDDLTKIEVPALVVYGDDDKIDPIGTSAMLSPKLIPRATLKVYAGAPHGLPTTHQNQFNADLLAVCRTKIRQRMNGKQKLSDAGT